MLQFTTSWSFFCLATWSFVVCTYSLVLATDSRGLLCRFLRFKKNFFFHLELYLSTFSYLTLTKLNIIFFIQWDHHALLMYHFYFSPDCASRKRTTVLVGFSSIISPFFFQGLQFYTVYFPISKNWCLILSSFLVVSTRKLSTDYFIMVWSKSLYIF